MRRLALFFALVTPLADAATARQVAAVEESRVVRTYPFSHPDPVPMLARDPRLYPYHGFGGYAVDGRPQAWRTIRLENEHVAVWVLPDAGGKVWGAVEKAGGEEFIYRNEVMKFRNIALRGPWMSGGIEFNFGVIGHAPWTATPVDYVLEQNTDGSASVVVGAMDIPSRTFWRVRVRLPAGESAFETETLWYNPTPLAQPYYNWMTAAAFARPDLELAVPGTRYLQHSGFAMPWPVDARGRTLSNYRENDFESHKSYHVVGRFEDFFGGYYHDSDYGFGHWAPYSDMPGQKMWLWSQAADGAIWAPLLTDTDGQYVEFQAGRLFVQYSPGGQPNPIRQARFDPYRTDRWTERWFPIRSIGGMSEASAAGVLHASVEGSTATVGVNAFRVALDTMVVRSGGRVVARRPLRLRPLAAAVERIDGIDPDDWSVELPALELDWSSRPDSVLLDRPFATDPGLSRPAADRLADEAAELLDARRLPDARRAAERALALDPWHPGALAVMADVQFRRGGYAEALDAARRLLQLDAYDPAANWLAGLAYQALGRRTDAREAFGWAQRATAFRAAAHIQLAELAMEAGDFDGAVDHANRALAYDVDGMPAHETRAVALRHAGRPAAGAVERLLELDPLSHFARAERWLASGMNADRDALRSGIRSELAEQTWLELAVAYVRRGLAADAARLLEAAPEHPMVLLWRAWLARASDPAMSERLLRRALAADPGFVFPFRPESVPVLDWADGATDAWQATYWRALLAWALDRPDEALRLVEGLGEEPTYGPFYAARAALRPAEARAEVLADLFRAAASSPEFVQLRLRLVDRLGQEERWEEARVEAERATRDYPAVFDATLAWARALLETSHHEAAAALLDTVRVVPSEGGGAAHQLFAWAHWALALDRLGSSDLPGAAGELRRSLEWPPSLGQGPSYAPDERAQKALLSLLAARRGRMEEAQALARELAEWAAAHPGASAEPDALVYRALAAAGMADEAAALLESLDGRPADPLAAWTAARIRGNREAAGAIRAFHPDLGRSLTFRLVVRALDRLDAP